MLALPSAAAGQSTVNPRTAEFDPSPDHSATDSSGTPLVQSYELGLYLVGASQPFQTNSLGKPTPDGTGTITVDLTTIFMGWPVPGTNYTADVAAVGPGGVARSALSNQFSFTSGSCSYTLSPTSQSVPAAGGTHTVSVTTTSGCAWTGVSNNTSFITVTGGSSGTGSGTVTYSVAARTSTTPRTGTLTIAGQTLTVTQSGNCSFSLSTTSHAPAAAGGALSVTVTTSSGCVWTTASNATWITVTSASSRTGSGTATYTVAANTSSSPRTGTLTIAGQTVTVTQGGSSSSVIPAPPRNVRLGGSN